MSKKTLQIMAFASIIIIGAANNSVKAIYEECPAKSNTDWHFIYTSMEDCKNDCKNAITAENKGKAKENQITFVQCVHDAGEGFPHQAACCYSRGE